MLPPKSDSTYIKHMFNTACVMHPQCEQPFVLSLLCRTCIGRASSVPEFRHGASKLRHLCLASSLRAAGVLLSGRRGILALLSDRSTRRASTRRRAMRRERQRRARTSRRAALRRARRRGQPRRRRRRRRICCLTVTETVQHGKAARAGMGPGRVGKAGKAGKAGTTGGRASKAGRTGPAAVGWKKQAGAASPGQIHLRRPRRLPRTKPSWSHAVLMAGLSTKCSTCSPMRRRSRCVLLGGRRCSKSTRTNQAAPPMSSAACTKPGKF